ncbi:MAG: ABC transporter permease [Actinobacteria bacterium]|nr:ABC transporter permease [Actinomycetota bacterium]
MNIFNSFKVKKVFKPNLSGSLPFLVLLVLFIIMVILKPQTFSLYYIGIKFDNALPLLFLAAGQTLILISGGIDLSVGGVMSLTTSMLAVMQLNPIIVISLTLVMGITVGIINGLIIEKLYIQPFIVTLAMWTILGGIAFLFLDMDGGVIDKTIQSIIRSKILNIPLSFYLAAGLVILWYLIKNSRFGYAMFAIGSNEKAAYCTGINIFAYKIKIYALCGLFSALAGIIYAGQVGSGSPTVGNNNILLSVAAAVIGGTSLSGGKGSITGAIIGVFIFKIIADVLLFAGITSFWVPLFQGLILIISVAISSLYTSIKDKAGEQID